MVVLVGFDACKVYSTSERARSDGCSAAPLPLASSRTLARALVASTATVRRVISIAAVAATVTAAIATTVVVALVAAVVALVAPSRARTARAATSLICARHTQTQ